MWKAIRFDRYSWFLYQINLTKTFQSYLTNGKCRSNHELKTLWRNVPIKTTESFQKKTVGITSSFGSEDWENERKEESEEDESGDGQDPPLADVALVLCRLCQEDHSQGDCAVQHHYEVRLEDKLALEIHGKVLTVVVWT